MKAHSRVPLALLSLYLIFHSAVFPPLLSQQQQWQAPEDLPEQVYHSNTLSYCIYHCCAGGGGGKDLKKETQLGLSNKKGEDFPKWYSELVVASELISYYDVSGEWLDF